MQPAIRIARLGGPLFVVIAIGILVDPAHYVGAIREGAGSPVLIYLSGVASFLAGVAILNAYRAWTGDWRVIVTILGWLLVIGGVIRTVVPRMTAHIATTLYSAPSALVIVGAIVLLVGGYLSFEGYRR